MFIPTIKTGSGYRNSDTVTKVTAIFVSIFERLLKS